MDEVWYSSSEVSLEVLVHPAAPASNAGDNVYREQGAALLRYLNGRLDGDSATRRNQSNDMLLQQTPAALEILVPETKSTTKKRAIHHQEPSFAIAESILVAAGSSRSDSGNAIVAEKERQTSQREAQTSDSITTSTASLIEQHTQSPKNKGTIATQIDETTRTQTKGKTWRDTELLTPVQQCTVSTVSPDSTKFKLQSPRGFQTRKRELENRPVEEPRPANARQALTEQSTNKRRRLDSAAEPDKPPAVSKSDDAGACLEPDGWLSSIALLTSSSSIESMPKPVASAELPIPEDDDAYIAPWPSSGEDSYTTHLVGTLALVAASQRLCAAYKPKRIKRKIEPLERGYWHLKIPYSWSTADQDGFWEMLEEMITQGKCGWGNWVEHIFEPTKRDENDGGKSDVCNDQAQKHIAEIKVWCWGEVVREIWLCLLMASRKQFLRLGMGWYDARGHLVIQMK